MNEDSPTASSGPGFDTVAAREGACVERRGQKEAEHKGREVHVGLVREVS